jgi:hypothetical protein
MIGKPTPRSQCQSYNGFGSHRPRIDARAYAVGTEQSCHDVSFVTLSITFR